MHAVQETLGDNIFCIWEVKNGVKYFPGLNFPIAKLIMPTRGDVGVEKVYPRDFEFANNRYIFFTKYAEFEESITNSRFLSDFFKYKTGGTVLTDHRTTSRNVFKTVVPLPIFSRT